jgi:hypothetical protein
MRRLGGCTEAPRLCDEAWRSLLQWRQRRGCGVGVVLRRSAVLFKNVQMVTPVLRFQRENVSVGLSNTTIGRAVERASYFE